MNTKITVLNNYVTNYKPKTNFNTYGFKRYSNKNTIYCRNFFLFLLLMKYNINGKNIKSNFFVKPLKKNVITFLRSPYRYKLARHQIFIQRYYVFSKITFFLNKKIVFSNLQELLHFYNYFITLNGWFETNLIYQHSFKLIFSFFFKKNFTFINYN